LTVKINGTEFNVDDSFQPQYWEAIGSGNWEPYTFKVIDYFVKESMTVLDLGCWAGPLSLYMAEKGALVHAIDPDPDAFNALEKNLELNPAIEGNVVAHKIAIGACIKQKPLHARTGYGNSSSSLLSRTRDTVATALVEVVKFNELVERNNIKQIGFIKIDIEGGEFDIIYRVEEALVQFDYPTILLSLHYSHLNESIYQSKFGVRWISLLAMKLEKYTGVYMSLKELESKSKRVLSLANRFKFSYNVNGRLISSDELKTEFLKDEYSELIFTNREWIQPIVNKRHK
jgi:FkbM family methyltransferase